MGDTTGEPLMNPFKHVKEELENDEEFFKLMSNQHKITKSFEGECVEMWVIFGLRK
jgi:hypothetical protein